MSTTFDPAKDIPDLSGKVMIVTGGNGGIGLATIKMLASKGATVYMASRTESKARAAIDSLGELKSRVKFLEIDLSDSIKVAKAAAEFQKLETRLDVIVNNAALLNDHGKVGGSTPDGIGDTMATNVLGPVEFTEALLPLLKKTAEEQNSDVRVVNVGSEAHRLTPSSAFATKEDWNNEFKSLVKPSSFTRYAYSKLGLHVWSNYFKKQVDEQMESSNGKITVVIIHPGAVYSDGTDSALKTLPFGLSHLTRKALPLVFKSSDQGAYASLFAAASPVVLKEREKYHGHYLEVGTNKKIKFLSQSDAALSEKTQNELMGCVDGILKARNLPAATST